MSETPIVREMLKQMRYEKLTDFVGDTVFGQGSFGRLCRICCHDDYTGPIEHAPWCEGVQEQITRFAKQELSSD